MKKLILIFVLLGCACAQAQFTGGYGAGQAPSTKVEKAALNGGPVADDVNLFTGTLSLSYDLGGVATVSGLSYPLRLSYSSAAITSFDAAHNSGIPYGEGWHLAEASVSVENVGFQFVSADNVPVTPSGKRIYTVEQAKAEGGLWFTNPTLSLPTGEGGRLIYKYPGEGADAGKAIYVLENFTKYVEAKFNGAIWEVVTEDGTVWKFEALQVSPRNPTGVTAHLDSLVWETSTAAVQAGRWHLTEVRHGNLSMSQRIELEYYKMGLVDFYFEQSQAQVQQALTAIGNVYNPNGNQPGPWNEVNCYRDVLLKSVKAVDYEGVIHSMVELKYKTWRPETELANQPLKLQRGRFLLLSDPMVLRSDSLYSRKTVWFTGQDQLQSQVHSPYGSRPALPAAMQQPFTNQWKRYQHPAAHENPLADLRPEISAINPYSFKLPQPPLNSGMSPNVEYRARTAATSTNLNALPFTHSVLESPRIDAAALGLPSGDLYELRTTVQVPAGVAMNFDLEIVSGVRHPLATPQVTHNVNYQGRAYEFIPVAPPSAWPVNTFSDRGYVLFSTRQNIIKWNPVLQQVPGFVQPIIMTTRNTFRLPNLPQECEGFAIQIGPGTDHLNYHIPNTTGDSYYHRFNNTGEINASGDELNLPLTNWFGTGAAWEPLYRTGRYGVSRPNNADNSMQQTAELWPYWYLDVADPQWLVTGGQLTDLGKNQPTAVTQEKLVNINPVAFYNFQSLDAAHQTTDSYLLNMELVRESRNPWMLDSVIFYVHNGLVGIEGPQGPGTGSMVRTSAFHFTYGLTQSPVLNNVDRHNGNPLAAVSDDYLYDGNGQMLWRNEWLLEGIAKLGTDTAGRYTNEAPTHTRMSYYSDDLNTIEVNEGALLQDVYNELGGRTSYTYYTNAALSGRLNSNFTHWPPPDRNHEVIGGGDSYNQWIAVKEKIVEDGSAMNQTTLYTYTDTMGLMMYLPLDEHFGNGMNSHDQSGYKRGYRTVTVYHPETAPGAGHAKTVFTFLQATLNDPVNVQRLFGMPDEVRHYDAGGALVSQVKTEYASEVVYPSAWRYPFGDDAAKRNSTMMRTEWGTVYPADYWTAAAYPSHPRLDSWFTRPVKTSDTQYDLVSGNRITGTKAFTYYDWDWTFHDTDGDYQRMYGPGNDVSAYLAAEGWFDAVYNTFTYSHEPSWQRASVTSSNSETPGAYTREEMYYLWDIGPFLFDIYGVSLPHTTVSYHEGSMRPYYLAKKYGMRNVKVEDRTEVMSGAAGDKPFGQSSYYWYEAFPDVGEDVRITGDTVYYGRYCEGVWPDGRESGGSVIVSSGLSSSGQYGANAAALAATIYYFGEAREISAEEYSEALEADARFVRDSSGLMWFYEIDSVREVGANNVLVYANEKGYYQGLDGLAHYFGVNAESGVKQAALVCLPHPHPDGSVCYCAHPSEESLLPQLAPAVAVQTPNPLPRIGRNPIANDSIVNPVEKHIFTNVLENIFALRAVYEQADSVSNVYLRYDTAAHNQYYVSIHNVWDSVRVFETIPDQYNTHYRFRFAAPFATIRTYYVHSRNQWGQVTEESDARHLHTLYEYEPGELFYYFDSCGKKFVRYYRREMGLVKGMRVVENPEPLAVNVIDRSVSLRYYPDLSLRRVVDEKGMESEYEYDGFKRMSASYEQHEQSAKVQYQLWNGNTAMSWQARTELNRLWMKSTDGIHDTLHSLSYTDPAGRIAQSIESYGVTGNYVKHFSGKTEYDGWGRNVRAHLSYGKVNQANVFYDWQIPATGFAESEMERNQRSRPLKEAAPGNAISGAQTVKKKYQIIPLPQFFSEAGLNAAAVNLLLPAIARSLAAGGVGNQTVPLTHPGWANYRLHKITGEDEDGKRLIEYVNANGQKLLTMQFTDAAYTDRVLTQYHYDGAGRVKRVIHPNGLQSLSRYNYLGMVIESQSPDAGRKRMAYNQAGDLRLFQDENDRAAGRMVVLEWDRNGRMIRKKTCEVPVVTPAPPGAGIISPLNYDAQGLLGTHSIIDEFFNEGADAPNHSLLRVNDYSQVQFPLIEWTESEVRLVKEWRWDHAQDTLAALNNSRLPKVDHSWIHTQVYNRVMGQAHCAGELALEKEYDEAGQLIALCWHGWSLKGDEDWTVRQFRADGLGELAPNVIKTGEAHLIEVAARDRQHRELAVNVDVYANGVIDVQHVYQYDGFGRLESVWANRRNFSAPFIDGTTQKVADYVYDELTGLLAKERRYVRDTACANVKVDSVVFSYDQKRRLTSMQSGMMDYSLYYDGSAVNAAGVAGAAAVQHGQHWNGNLNGWRVQYKVSAGNALVSQAAAGFAQPTVYGFKYDGINRLTQADATVFENVIAPAGPSFNAAGNYGVPLMGQVAAAWYGDERYAYDKAGNLTGLRRYYYFAPNTLQNGNAPKGDNWIYEYYGGTNKLRRLTTAGPGGGNGGQQVHFTYDGNGNVTADLRRGLTGIQYNEMNLPYRMANAGGNVQYLYSEDERMHKRVIETATNDTTEIFYLRDGDGRVMAVWEEETASWAFELFGTPIGIGGGVIGEWTCPVNQLNPQAGGPSFLPDVKFFVKDHLGNTRVAYKAGLSAACLPRLRVVSVMDFTPYGKHLRSYFAEGPERWQTTGNERDVESGLDYRGARYYDSEYGRFLAIDPLGGEAPSWSPYNYVFGNPTKLSDPDGLWPGWLDAIGSFIADGVQLGLGVVGEIPILGEPADLLNAGISVARGDWSGAFMDLASAMPFAGNAPGSANIARRLKRMVLKDADDAAGAAKLNKAARAPQPTAPTSGLDDLRRKARREIEMKYWNKSTKFENVRVYQRDDLINPYYIDNKGRSNVQRMKEGVAPIGPDGESLNLHHMIQTEKGGLAEVTNTFHKENYSVIHINPNTTPSGINRKNFESYRKRYWKQRANDFIN